MLRQSHTKTQDYEEEGEEGEPYRHVVKPPIILLRRWCGVPRGVPPDSRVHCSGRVRPTGTLPTYLRCQHIAGVDRQGVEIVTRYKEGEREYKYVCEIRETRAYSCTSNTWITFVEISVRQTWLC